MTGESPKCVGLLFLCRADKSVCFNMNLRRTSRIDCFGNAVAWILKHCLYLVTNLYTTEPRYYHLSELLISIDSAHSEGYSMSNDARFIKSDGGTGMSKRTKLGRVTRKSVPGEMDVLTDHVAFYFKKLAGYNHEY